MVPKLVTIRFLLLSCVVGAIAGLVVAIAATLMDWRVNPSGIFHDDSGTAWHVVFETMISWFWPTALVTLAVMIVTALLRGARRRTG